MNAVNQLLVLFLVSVNFCHAHMFDGAIPAHQTHALIYVYIGKSLPTHLADSVYQARLFNQCPIYILANQQAIDQYKDCKNLDVTMVPVENLTRTKEHDDFAQRSTIDRTFREGFWFLASERFLYIHDFMQQYDVRNIFMIESDVMIYAKLDTMLPVFERHYKGLGVTFSNDDLVIPGIVYAKDKACVALMAKCFAAHAHEAKNDGEIFAVLKKEEGQSCIDGLPIIMYDYPTKHVMRSSEGKTPADCELYMNHVDDFKSIFDGRAFGMFLGGVDPRNTWDPQQGPGHISEYCVINPSNMGIEWLHDEKKRRVPYAVHGAEKYRINNLHIHAKHLKPFLSL